ncbi:hypothetical protein [uncultured Enterococcus sp.]|uniref:hypothetical protein n=1 Tax=uncultured Enterococcus sp. TaxID=167972 RepID=UPI0025971CCA|nr:hypothetical protein [uncultured Enterococcus sp.]
MNYLQKQARKNNDELRELRQKRRSLTDKIDISEIDKEISILKASIKNHGRGPIKVKSLPKKEEM